MSVTSESGRPLTFRVGPEVLHQLPPLAAAVVQPRLRLVVQALAETECGLEGRDLAEAVAKNVGPDSARLWLTRSVLGADLPTDDEMTEILIRFRLGGLWTALAPTVDRLAEQPSFADVRVITGRITCDVGRTASTGHLSGIQRVVREAMRRWHAARDVVFVAWTRGYRGMRLLNGDERTRMFGERVSESDTGAEMPVVVPWHGLHVCPELVSEPERVDRMLAVSRHSGLRLADIGYDCIPITSASTPGPGMVSRFARSLAARRNTERIAAISDAAAQEYRGWVGMCAGRRGRRPDVATIRLPAEAQHPSEHECEQAQLLLKTASRPLVLMVGSHEPRKNHLAVLHAAETLWRVGLDFTLALVGAGAWQAEEYYTEVARLRGLGRPIESITGLSDHLLWAAYRIAHCTVFPSLNEGFGLPVAESLAAGTPVITSDYGSMRDIVMVDGQPRGGLLVNPRDDASITEALRTVLTDNTTYGRLKRQTADRPTRTWDDYAAELWGYLVNGRKPA